MRLRHKLKTIAGIGLGLALAAAGPDLYSCSGLMSFRFLPIKQAREQFAKVQAELAKRRALLPALESIPEATPWVKYYDNPVFGPGEPGSWESKSADCHTVGFYDNKYWLWYVGTPRNLNCQIGLATSPDGVHWTRHPENPVLRLGPAGSWDDSILICQHILFDEARKIFEMWYVGGNEAGVFGIGYASSTDGVHWTKYVGNPVMTVTESWEGTALEGQTLLKMDGTYKMWYGGIKIGTDVSYIGYAESADGIHWTKYAGNPIISPAADDPLPWDGYSVDTPDVYHDGKVYQMYYRGWREEKGVSWIGHATSVDGINWVRDPANPVFLTASAGGVWDNWQIYRARVFWGAETPDPQKLVVDRMWYTGRDRTLTSQIGLAFRVRQPGESEAVRAAFPQGVVQDRMELSLLPGRDGEVRLAYFSPWISNIGLTVFDEKGRTVRTLVRAAKLPGFYDVAWDGTDDAGRKAPSGLYYVELKGDHYVLMKEVVFASGRS